MRRFKQLTFFIVILLSIVVLLYIVGNILNTERRLTFGKVEQMSEQVFYVSPTGYESNGPGELIKTEKLLSTPAGMDGWRVMYTSTDKDNNQIIVTGLIVAPSNMKKDEKHTVVSWGHPTTGIAPRCAPSVGIDPFDSIEGLRDLVHNGYIVVATDYSGMGIPGSPSFLIGETEGRNVLDIVRASHDLLPNNASSDVFLWGHSQGGHAGLFAEQIAASYASELTIKGVATAAPATKLGELLTADEGDVSGVTIGSYAMSAYSKAYSVDLTSILTPEGISHTPVMADLCLLGQNQKIHDIATPLIGNYFKSSPQTTEPWATMLSENTPGLQKIKAPLFVAQGDIDTLVRPEITQSFVDEQKALGANVTYVPVPKTGHGMVALKAMPDVIKWMANQK